MKVAVFFAMALIACVAAQTEPCICPGLLEPTCGADGVTYANPCEAGCAGATVAYAGECETPTLL